MNHTIACIIATAVVLGLGASEEACLDRPVARAEPLTTTTFSTTIAENTVDQIDILFDIDNSASMGDKQALIGCTCRAAFRVAPRGARWVGGVWTARGLEAEEVARTPPLGVGGSGVFCDEEQDLAAAARWGAALRPMGEHRRVSAVRPRHESSGDRARQYELGKRGDRALEKGCAEGGPDEALDDGGVLGLQGTEVGVRLQVFEEELDLPSKAVKLPDGFGAEVRRKIGEQPGPRLLFAHVAWMTRRSWSERARFLWPADLEVKVVAQHALS